MWHRIGLTALAFISALITQPKASLSAPPDAIEIGTRRELFVDHHLIDRLEGVELRMHSPIDEGPVLQFDKPWEGLFCGYATVIHDGELYRLYYRGRPEAGSDGDDGEVTCYAESRDGIHWTRPELDLFTAQGEKVNNIVLAHAAPVTHNFCPFLDTREGVPDSERFKAIGGTMSSGLLVWSSPDGIRWTKWHDKPVLTKENVPFPYMFDSQNLAFWSEAELKYVSYFRVFKDKIRRICRATSDDLIHWSKPVLMEYRHDSGPAPVEHLYTNQTHPYFRAPHIYVGVAARFMPGRQVLSDKQAAELHVDPKYFKDTSDAILLTTRGGNLYDRTFLSSFIRPGIGLENWVSRTNYPALNVVQTSPTELSIYVNQNYAQPTAHLRRYSLRLDGFASAHAPYAGGELLTKPLTFTGKALELNFSTSAAGSVRVEIQNAAGEALPGFALADAVPQIGNEIERLVEWKQGRDVSTLAGQPVRLRFVMQDADIFSFRFQD